MKGGYVISKRKRSNTQLYTCILACCAVVTSLGLLILTLKSVDPQSSTSMPVDSDQDSSFVSSKTESKSSSISKTCATVEEMGQVFENVPWKENLRVRELIRRHFYLNGAERIRGLSPEQFCSHGFVLGKASEAGFGNEMYKILTAAALSIMLNRSLIIGQTRGKYPFGDYISYSHQSFSLGEVKHLWRRNGCLKTYGRPLITRTDDFEKPAHTNVLCSNWKKWKQPIIWFQNTTDAVAAQFFLKNIHPEMKNAASALFGDPESLHSRPNVFGELMRVLVSPSNDVKRAVNWVLDGGMDPDISVHMRMLMNRPARAVQATLTCIKKAVNKLQGSRPRVVVVSDTPSVVKSMMPAIREFAETLHFDYNLYKGNISADGLKSSDFRVKDWGPAPRWVAFVDFFLASRAKHAVVSGAHRRVGTTYAQLIAALAAANNLGDTTAGSNLSFLSSFQSNLLAEGLRLQIGWGHVWNRFAGRLSCHNQPDQCAFTPLLPPAWWDGLWQSPIPRDIKRLATYGIQLSGFGTVDEDHLHSFCSRKKNVVRTIPVIV